MYYCGPQTSWSRWVCEVSKGSAAGEELWLPLPFLPEQGDCRWLFLEAQGVMAIWRRACMRYVRLSDDYKKFET